MVYRHTSDALAGLSTDAGSLDGAVQGATGRLDGLLVEGNSINTTVGTVLSDLDTAGVGNLPGVGNALTDLTNNNTSLSTAISDLTTLNTDLSASSTSISTALSSASTAAKLRADGRVERANGRERRGSHTLGGHR